VYGRRDSVVTGLGRIGRGVKMERKSGCEGAERIVDRESNGL
jgi:hypothetical protein